jgi:hypothetical protein
VPRLSFRPPVRRILETTTELRCYTRKRRVTVDHLACGHIAIRQSRKTVPLQLRFCLKCWGKQK